MSMSNTENSENKYIFDELNQQREVIEATFGAPLNWERMDENKGSLINYQQDFDGYDRENWPEIIDWMTEHIVLLETAMKEPLKEVNRSLKHVDMTTELNDSD